MDGDLSSDEAVSHFLGRETDELSNIINSANEPREPYDDEKVPPREEDNNGNLYNSGSDASTTDTSGTNASSLESYRQEAENQASKQRRGSSGTIEDRTSGLPSVMRTATNYWSPRMKHQRRKVIFHFFRINAILALFCFTVFVIFWGASYNTKSYFHKINFLAVIQEDTLGTNMTDIVPLTSILPALLRRVPGHWHVLNDTQFKIIHSAQTPEQINEKVIDLIYDEVFWVAVNVKPNVTQALYNSLTSQEEAPFNATNYFQYVFESARDPSNVKSVIFPVAQGLETMLQQVYALEYLPSLARNISANTLNIENLASAGKLNFEYLDYRPFADRLLMTVTQLGCVYAIVLTCFQFLVYSPLHLEMSALLKRRDSAYYRIAISFLTHFFASLFVCTVSAIYQVDFTKAFGRGGFVIFWMTTWLFMWSVGGANENVMCLIFAGGPQYIGFWILGFVLINISPTFFPLVLNNAFYRYGYMMPLHNVVSIYRVIFFDLSRGKMGRNYGILAAWVVLNTILLPFDLKLTRYLIRRRRRKEVEAEASTS
ncbi:SNG1 family protein KNAG_0G01790 [Huiozyma naganishii CBS 8797]|uniref:DUF3533 domain-containing protein n=1 Tax=Huiozyma naganishii (strain ATCC MYA-139 / BCRC 22969 / CBS 8797 / KCTC 17520 / NBRC 10181 / NCYC 3082 / Yp74L-3) TaxID=1071383 RepID=J7S100_HUIN7|nr:hypothetical protein KNAG_0G01790 [Kazachstania naganishii CBS 8797]CCK71237.1 hypothetical protein KNAG_0G01790 [Kazachstania naganishii CBS 8797]